jgi:hypothetical protein
MGLYNQRNKILSSGLLGSVFLITALSGCGQMHYSRVESAGNASTVVWSSSPIPNPSPTPSTTSQTNLAAVYSYPVISKPYAPNTALNFMVKANKVLKVRFKPKPTDIPVPGTGYPAQYSMLGVYLMVNGTEKPTPPLYNGLTQAAEWSPIMDFSAQVPHLNCDVNDTTCREDVVVTVEKPNYDYWCYNYGSYCPYTKIYGNHPWNGTLEVQTDDTFPLQ